MSGKREKSWIRLSESPTSTAKRNIYGYKVLLDIRWDQQDRVYYELLVPNEAVTADVYRRHLIKLNDALLQRGAAKPFSYMTTLGHAIAARMGNCTKRSDYNFFRSMQHGSADTRFRNAEKMRKCFDNWITAQPILVFRHGIAQLSERLEKVVERLLKMGNKSCTNCSQCRLNIRSKV